MPEYIEREIAISAVRHAWAKGLEPSQYIEEIPAVNVAPVVQGQWEQVKSWATKAKYRCSVCGREIMSAAKVNIEKYPYCHCGAKMDGGTDKRWMS